MGPRGTSSPDVLRTAFGLTLLGDIAGVAGAVLAGLLVFETSVPASDPIVVFQSRGIQFGFLAVALGYIYAHRDTGRYVRIRRPRLGDVIWILAVPMMIWVAYVLIGPILELVGLPGGGAAGGEVTLEIIERPALWLPVFIAFFVIGAPAEELLFRGVIQGRLRERFDPVVGVAIAAGCFALMHLCVFLLDGQPSRMSSAV